MSEIAVEPLKTYVCTVVITTEVTVEAADEDDAREEARRVLAGGDVIGVVVDEWREEE